VLGFKMEHVDWECHTIKIGLQIVIHVGPEHFDYTAIVVVPEDSRKECFCREKPHPELLWNTN
jgi:hypothetical protein